MCLDYAKAATGANTDLTAPITLFKNFAFIAFAI